MSKPLTANSGGSTYRKLPGSYEGQQSTPEGVGAVIKKITYTTTRSLSSEVIFVVQGVMSNLLRFLAIQNLYLIKRVDFVNVANSIKQ